jgi:putative endonuclease
MLRRLMARLCRKPRNIGEYGEDLACRFIKKHGYSILARNWRFRHAEIDIIARCRDILVFIEVRLRDSGSLVRGYESISAHKKFVLRLACLAFLKKHTKNVSSYRFDVIDIEHDYSKNADIIYHYENVPIF